VDLATPLTGLLTPLGLDLYDVEVRNGTVEVIVSREGGVDLDTLTSATRTVSEWLDANDPMPGRYTLDVSSPGLERKLRTPRHFQSAIGEIVTLRQRRGDEPTRRLEGIVSAATDTTLTITDASVGEVTVAYDDIERARTVFHWGSEAKPTPSRGNSAKKKG
jgi:ribosome maturation factor RimP